MNHLSLFSGVGGFDLAAEWAGFTTVAFCEKDKFCQQVLAKHWPGVPVYDNIFSLTAYALAARGIEPGSVRLITAGFPCQPYSFAGKRLGNEDDRALWPEAYRVIREVKPVYVLLENVPGLIPLALDGVLSDLEAAGYETGVYILPACAVNAPHRRDRVFIVAHSQRSRGYSGEICPGNQLQTLPAGAANPFKPMGERCENVAYSKSEQDRRLQQPRVQPNALPGSNGIQALPNPDRQGLPLPWITGEKESQDRTAQPAFDGGDWWAVEPSLGRTLDGLSPKLDFAEGGINAHQSCYEKTSAESLSNINQVRKVRGNKEPAAPPSRSQRCVICGNTLSEMPYPGRYEAGEMGSRAEEDQNLLSMWKGIYQLHKQQGKELQPGMPGYCRQDERQQTLASILSQSWDGNWERGIPRTASGVKDRVSRLRALGNAVVPQIAYPILKAIADWERAA